MNPLHYLWIFLKASLFSTGGMGNLPSLHRDLIARKWATEKQFAESLTIGQISPGPNGLWVVSLGYITNGALGAAIGAIAATVPPFIVLLVDRAYQKIKDQPAVTGFVRGMSLAVAGTFIVIIPGLLRTSGIGPRSIGILVGSMALAVTGRVPLYTVIAGSALLGILVR